MLLTKSTKYYAGIDLHKNYCFMTVINNDGLVMQQGRFENDEDKLVPSILQYDDIEAVVESTYGWYWLADKLEKERINFKLAHPKKVNAIAGKKKTDEVDAKILADLLRVGLLPQAYVPCKQVRSVKEILRFRMNLVGQRATLKRRLHDILRKQNINCPYSDVLGKKSQDWLVSLDCPEPYGEEIESLLIVATTLDEQIHLQDKKITNLVKEDGQAKLLQTIPGIGKVLALVIGTEIADIGRFDTDRALASYAGVVPSVKSSGDKTYLGRTGKRGNKYLRLALAEATPHLIRKDPRVKAFYDQLALTKGKGKAKVAIMNKLTRIIFAMLKKNRAYQIQQLAKEQLTG